MLAVLAGVEETPGKIFAEIKLFLIESTLAGPSEVTPGQVKLHNGLHIGSALVSHGVDVEILQLYLDNQNSIYLTDTQL